jgi:hypothetical protein
MPGWKPGYKGKPGKAPEKPGTKKGEWSGINGRLLGGIKGFSFHLGAGDEPFRVLGTMRPPAVTRT